VGAPARAGGALAARGQAEFDLAVRFGGGMGDALGVRKRLHFYSLRFYSLFRITKLNSILRNLMHPRRLGKRYPQRQARPEHPLMHAISRGKT
jgi:hypothetical protein